MMDRRCPKMIQLCRIIGYAPAIGVMMEKISFAAIAVLSAGALFASDGIKDAMPFSFGVAIPSKIYMGAPDDSTRLVERHFNSITPENEMKPMHVQPREGEFHWDVADRFVAFGERNRMKIIGHCLVWHNQTPRWFFVNADGSKADRETLIARMRAHIHAVVGRYKGRIHGWDVVNEAFDDAGNLHPSPWRDGIGDDFIELAFRFAHEADPDVELYYNDFNMFMPGKRRGVVEMVRRFKEKGVRIDAVGLQSHAGLKSPKVEEYEATIEALASAGVKAMVTELDISALPSAWGLTAEITSSHDYDDKYNPWKDGVLPKDVEKEHAKRYVDLFKMYLRHADVIDRVTIWGLTDGDSWLNDFPVRGRTDYPLFFGRDGKMKPCAKAVWWTAQQASEKKPRNGK